MTLHFVFAITSDREVGLMRKRGQYIQIPSGSRLFHFPEKTPLECLPSFFVADGKDQSIPESVITSLAIGSLPDESHGKCDRHR